MPKDLRCVRIARIAIALTALAAAFMVLAGAASAKTAYTKAHATRKAQVAKKAHDVGTLPPEGIFDSCDVTVNITTCEQDLTTIHAAGLQVVVTNIPLGATLDELSSYATAAQTAGVSVMWELNDAGFWGGTWTANSAGYDYSEFSTACGCTDSAAVLAYMIQWLGALPATYGYYAADDWTLTPNQTPGLTQYVSEIKAADPGHMVMIGSAPSQGKAFYATGATIGNDIYPETTGDLMPASQNLASWDGVQQAVTQDQRSSTQSGTGSAFILQAFTFGDSLDDGEAVGVCKPSMSESHCASLLHYPSAGVQLQLRNEVLEHAHPALILWYTFTQANADGNRWGALTSAVTAPYPVIGSAARAKRTKAHRKAARHQSQKHHARKHRSGRKSGRHGRTAKHPAARHLLAA